MENTIDELFNGNIRPNSQLPRITEMFRDAENELLRKLKDGENELFRDYIGRIYGYHSETVRENFKLGFKLGVSLITESLK